MFLNISQNSQENTCARVSFLIMFIKKETPAQVFSRQFWGSFQNIFFGRIPTVAASVWCNLYEVFISINLIGLTVSHPQDIQLDLKRFKQHFVNLMVVLKQFQKNLFHMLHSLARNFVEHWCPSGWKRLSFPFNYEFSIWSGKSSINWFVGMIWKEHLRTTVSNHNDMLCDQGIIHTKMEIGIRFWAPNLGLSPKCLWHLFDNFWTFKTHNTEIYKT